MTRSPAPPEKQATQLLFKLTALMPSLTNLLARAKKLEQSGQVSSQSLAATYLLINDAFKAIEAKDVKTAKDKLTKARSSLKSVKLSIVRTRSNKRRLH